MSRLATAFVLGYHGCEKAVADAIIGSDTQHLAPSRQDYDWLGSGIYFWEADPRRALEWAAGRGLRARSHAEIAVINPDCIKGYFRPRSYPR